MKLPSALAIAYLTLTTLAAAQTADDYVAQGRSFLSATNIVAANTSFSNAVALSPAHQTGNAFYGVTRLLVLPFQPAGSNFLNRLGVPLAGRDIYNWTAEIPRDTNGVPYTQAGLNATEATQLLRTNLLAEVLGAQANLAKVTDPGFTVALSSNETRSVAVTLDRGDILMFRAILHTVEYAIYTAHSWNIDADLSVIRYLWTNNQFSVERLLTDHPQLLNFSTTNDLNAAKTAFQRAVACYLDASQVIRSRLAAETRLFNYDPDSAQDEENFRITVTELTNSLSGAVTLTVNTNLTVFLASHFDGPHPVRSFLPIIRGNSFGLNTSDQTFGGLITGLRSDQIDQYFAKALYPMPTISPGIDLQAGHARFTVNVAPHKGYVVQVSSNLVDWLDRDAFFAIESTLEFSDPHPPASPRCFYRLVDRTTNMPPPRNDLFANRELIPGINVSVNSYTASASYEPPEIGWLFGMGHTIWWTWVSPVSAEVQLVVDPANDDWQTFIFTGSNLSALTPVANGWNRLNFQAQAGVTYQIAVDTYESDGGVRVALTRPPEISVTSPADGAVFTRPANVLISASVSDPDGQPRELSLSGDWHLHAVGTINYLATNLTEGYYYLYFEAQDNIGGQAWDNRWFRVSPTNDNFVNATQLAGTPLTATGTLAGSAREPGEPNHAGNSGNSSVWWSWRATSSGPVTVVCEMTNRHGGGAWPDIAVYTGNFVSSLSVVASNSANLYFQESVAVTFSAVSGSTYRIAVTSGNYEGGEVLLRFLSTQAPSVEITEPVDSQVFTAGSDILISADAFDLDGTITQVDFFLDGELLGTRSALPYSFTWSNADPGQWRELVARARDNLGVVTYSWPIYIHVMPPAPPNDDFAGRIPISGSTINLTTHNLGATAEWNEPMELWNGGSSVWWTWQAPRSGLVTLSTGGSDFDTLLGVYSGDSLDSLTPVAFNDDDPSSGDATSRVDFFATGGTFYHIVVDGANGQQGEIRLNLAQP